MVVIAFALLVLFDLVGVDRRYVNSDNFVSARNVEKPFTASEADKQILQDKSHYRVFDTGDGGSRTSYFHNSVWGYHAAKPGRYQELFDFHVNNQNEQVFNMLNIKYIVTGENQVIKNDDAYGNAWFVNKVVVADNANEEIKLLDSLNLRKKAVVDKRFALSAQNYELDSLATISLTSYKPDALTYSSKADSKQLAVFSEMYYANGWNAYIDGVLTPHIRANYVLRALEIPEGEHIIEFKFEPGVVKTGSTIALAASVIFILLFLGAGYLEWKSRAKVIDDN